jgi:hypothetical protein
MRRSEKSATPEGSKRGEDGRKSGLCVPDSNPLLEMRQQPKQNIRLAGGSFSIVWRRKPARMLVFAGVRQQSGKREIPLFLQL